MKTTRVKRFDRFYIAMFTFACIGLVDSILSYIFGWQGDYQNAGFWAAAFFAFIAFFAAIIERVGDKDNY